MEMHQAKAIHAAEKLRAKQSHLYCPNLAAGTDDHHHLGQNEPPPAATTHGHIHQPVGLAADPMTRTAIPTYPLGGNPIPPAYNKHLQQQQQQQGCVYPVEKSYFICNLTEWGCFQTYANRKCMLWFVRFAFRICTLILLRP